MNRPEDFDTAQGMGGSGKLKPGGYICYIKQAEERKTKDGRDMVAVMLDIYDGEYKDYFMRKFNKKKEYAEPGAKVKYPNDGIAYLPVKTKEGKTQKKFKSFCDALEQSGVELQWNENFAPSLKDKLIGVVFRREEQDYAGMVWWAVKPYTFVSVERIQDGLFTVPDDLPLSEQGGDAPQTQSGFSSLSNDDIPF